MTAELDPDELREVVERAKSRSTEDGGQAQPTEIADAWEILYRHCYQRLISYALRRLPTRHLAEDAVSEAMFRAVRNIDRFTWQGAGFDGWMYGILRNVVLEQLRKPARADQLLERFGNDPTRHPQPAVTPQDHLDRLIDSERLRAAFGRLDPGDQEILELRVVGELSAGDVGAVVGKSAGAVRMAQSRALERLRQAMEEVTDE